jgi:hypothetical protein
VAAAAEHQELMRALREADEVAGRAPRRRLPARALLALMANFRPAGASVQVIDGS